MKSILVTLFFFSFKVSAALLIRCENGYSFKILNFQTSNSIIFYSLDKNNWIKVENHSFLNDSVTLFIPELKYLACSDKTLPICSYGIKISKISQSRPITQEIVLNNCYIGTMGCNEYNKGLELNQSSCKKY